MKKKISANDCKAMFNDKFSSLTMKELGIELKHFSMGTAPETPSFLVNQDELKKKITEKFCDFCLFFRSIWKKIYEIHF